MYWLDSEFKLDLAIVNTQSLHEERSEARNSSTTQRGEYQESLNTIILKEKRQSAAASEDLRLEEHKTSGVMKVAQSATETLNIVLKNAVTNAIQISEASHETLNEEQAGQVFDGITNLAPLTEDIAKGCTQMQHVEF